MSRKRTKAAEAERQEQLTRLREWIKPGDTVYTILDHVSRSGMSRAIRVLVPLVGGPSVESVPPSGKPTDYVRKDGITVDFIHPNYAVGQVLGLKHWKRNGREQDALVVGGCGMDMGFHLVYELSHALYGARLVPDVYKDSATHDRPGGQLLTRIGAPEGHVYIGGYPCLGKDGNHGRRCPSNYHTNHRDTVSCDGLAGQRCYTPYAFGRFPVAADWPRRMIDIGEGETVDGGYLACLEYVPGEAPIGAAGLISREDGSALQVCPTCKGAGSLPNPEGPERWDLVHTDGYAVSHRWL